MKIQLVLCKKCNSILGLARNSHGLCDTCGDNSLDNRRIINAVCGFDKSIDKPSLTVNRDIDKIEDVNFGLDK